VTRDEAAAETGISRKLAAFHLDKLVRSGLLQARYQSAMDGPQPPGRPPKVYEPTNTEVTVSIPTRRYDMAADILLDTIERTQPGQSPRDVAQQVTAERGIAQGQAIRAERSLGRVGAERALSLTAEAVEAAGFEPARTKANIVLRNCPFRALAQKDPQLICNLNLAFIRGLLKGLGNDSVEAALVPWLGHCCVELRLPTGR
jgi:predicted ArsR family transcriptional regulator